MTAGYAARRLEFLPITGPGAVETHGCDDVDGDLDANPAVLVALMTSIGTDGMLQPVLVEEVSGRRHLVAGRRRLRAARMGHALQPTNPHFHHIPSLVCAGPLSPFDRQAWPLLENLARSAVQPAELAQALLQQRCELLLERLLGQAVAVPAAVASLEDPVVRFRALDQLRTAAGLHRLGAPWADVLRRLGRPMGPDIARRLVRVFTRLPPEISAQMDAAQVALATRVEFVQLADRDGDDRAHALWAHVAAAGRPDLFRAAVLQCLATPGTEPSEALSHADAVHQRANQARSRQPGTGCVDPGLVARVRDSVTALLGSIRSGERLEHNDAEDVATWAQDLLDAAQPTGGRR